ncbi:MAG: peptidoglycan DD-metalloendopeptidase family protein [Alicyclobacillus sp.]|nr:peptidoglycan DD-metalloendopeptidase family protein [Alicyclobacillus sp.]
MSRKHRALVAAGTAMVLLAAVATPAVTYASQLSDARQKAAQLAQQKQETQQKIGQLSQQEQSITQQIHQIEAAVSKLDSSILHTQADIVRRNLQIKQLQQEIAQTEQKLNEQYGVLERRLRVIYEDGQSSYLEVLLSATSFSDFLDRVQMLADIAKQDKLVLVSIQQNQQQLTKAQQAVQQQLTAVKQAYQVLLEQKTEQQNQQRKETALLAQVHDSKLSAEADLKSEQAAMNGLQALIQQLEAQEGAYTGASDGWTWPVPGYTTVSSGYGWRTWPDGSREFHDGIDIAAPLGAKMVAATGGKVLYAGPASGFGDWVVIQSAGGLLEIYGHMYAYQLTVHPGEIVSKGQQIASVGNNGNSTGPHLHFTIATGFDAAGYPISVDPTKYVGSGG